MPENGNLRGAAGVRSSTESFPHFYIFLFAFLIIFPIRFVPEPVRRSSCPT
jgi:hypothetical protein